MEDPEALACPHVESPDVAFHIFPALGNSAGQVRGPDNYDILGYDGRRMKADLPGDQIDLLIVVLFQVHHAILAEAGYRDAGLGIESDEPVTGRNVQDSLLLAIRPVGDSVA